MVDGWNDECTAVRWSGTAVLDWIAAIAAVRKSGITIKIYIWVCKTSARLMKTLILTCVLSVLSLLCNAEHMEFHNFQPPYQDVDNSGERLASRHWRSSGVTVVNTNFIRLTPDRQSKKGALWSRKAVGVSTFSSILKFRISGQGKNFYGDGIGFWVTQHGYYSEGNLHGSEEKFVGVGIIFDTFKNTENLAAHRDVTILINNGEQTLDLMTKDVQGCNANFRYHADRADFSVTDASRAKVTIGESRFVH